MSNSLKDITDRLLLATVRKPLPDFVKDFASDGGDATSLTFAIAMSTMNAIQIDARTAQAWIDDYA